METYKELRMNNICWVTGFSKDYYNNIGQHTLKTWKYLKEDKIFLCEMDPALVKLDAYKIDIRNELKNYYPELQKDIHTRAKKAYKFFKKAYCIWYALEHYSKEYDYIIWIDTDSVIQQPINLKDLLPNSNQMFSTIIRGENACDSGFIVFNTKHNNFENFKNEYIDYYISGKIWNMHKPWDAYV